MKDVLKKSIESDVQMLGNQIAMLQDQLDQKKLMLAQANAKAKVSSAASRFHRLLFSVYSSCVNISVFSSLPIKGEPVIRKGLFRL